MRIHLSALGCRLNEAELEQWAQSFSREGDTIASDETQADVLVMNTCAVTSEAVRKSRQRIQKLQRQNPSAKVVVSGCYSTLEKPETLSELGVDLVVTNEMKDQLVTLTRDAFSTPSMPEGATVPAEAPLFQRNRHRAFIKIQDGCRYRCTFCIVTVARGAERSRSISDIVQEVNTLVADGIKEIVLTGVHVGGYGSDLDADLQSLVSTLLCDTTVERIRFASVEPWDLAPGFLTLFDDSRLMPHMHLPLQSGSDTVLKRMARRCKTGDFQALATELRSSIPGFNITTDIIVGFPGETPGEWAQSVEAIAAIGFGHIHIFNYSVRLGTKAATLPNQVPKQTRQERSRELHELAAQLRFEAQNSQLGSQVPVLWERGKAVNGGFEHSGYTPNYFKVKTISRSDLANQVLMTRLDTVDGSELSGTPLL